jgi:DNA topoisomerase 2-associated protein PAT1
MSKGKKLIPRVWRHLDENQKLTVLTLIAVHLDNLDVIAQAVPPPDNPDAPLSAAIKDEVELFATTVIPTFFTFLGETDLRNIEGLLGLILDRSVIPNIVRTKVGVCLLSVLISRVEVLKESAQLQPSDLEEYARFFNRLFDLAEPALPYLFTPGSAGSASIHDADDMHIWQFLAAMGAGATPDQQQRLVMGVKDRVMDTITVSRALPPELKERRLGNVNLFMRAIGLDVELLVRGV